MKRKILKITGFFACVMVLISIYFGFQFFQNNDISYEKNVVNELIKDLRNERKKIHNKSKELETIKTNQKEKSSLLEVWQKENEKLKK